MDSSSSNTVTDTSWNLTADDVRRAYIRAARGIAAALDFEQAVLGTERCHLPECAVAVLDGGDPNREYWAFLLEQIRTAD